MECGEQKFVELFRTTYVTVVDIWIVAVIQIQTGRVNFSFLRYSTNSTLKKSFRN